MLTACGGGNEQATNQPSATQANNAEQSANTAPTGTELAQSITSATGVNYQLPAGWVVDDNESVSNFASDEDAVLDFLGQQERNARWLIIGSFGTTDTNELDGLVGVSTLADAIPVLDNYSTLAYNPVVGPETITLANGAEAYFVINTDDDIWNVRYHILGAEGVIINLYFSGSESSINAVRDLMTAIANSASYTQP
jgi:hypothetical protein